MKPTLFAFDLDGTITTQEILPLLAAELDLAEEFSLLTDLTVRGLVDFSASLKLRFHILRSVPLKTVQDIVRRVPLNSDIEAFIHKNKECCRVITGNVDCWVEPLIHRLGCGTFSSRSSLNNGQLVLTSILDKGEAMRTLKKHASRLIAIGESAGDVPMFEAADIGVAYAGVHEPAPALLTVTDHVVYDGVSLCRLLEKL